MKKNVSLIGTMVLLLSGISLNTHSDDLVIGKSDGDYGSLKASGYLRARYQDKDYSNNDHKLTFNTAKLDLDYKKSDLFAHAEYRCYQFDKLCDFSALVAGYVGYQLDKNQDIKLGLVNVPFGPSRFWESNWYGGINSAIGLEDVHNLGVSYTFQPLNHTKVDLAYFYKDGGDYFGKSQDSARYSANLVKSDDPQAPNTKEKNMFVGRINQVYKLPGIDQASFDYGLSYWYSEIKDKSFNQDGDRQAWSLFNKFSYHDFAISIVGGQNTIKLDNGVDYVTVGSFDDTYKVAKKGTFYTVDMSYIFKNLYHEIDVTPYAMYSSYLKKDSAFANSTRNIFGVDISRKNISVVGEYILGKNDMAIGGDENSLFTGADQVKTNRLFNLTFLYKF